MRIGWDNRIDEATLAASSAGVLFPVENLQNVHLDTPWRSLDVPDESVVFDAGAGKTIEATTVAIFAHNFTAGATVTLEGNDADSWAAPAFSQALVIVEVISAFFASQSHRYWRLHLQDAGNGDGHLSIGRVFLGPFLQLLRIEPNPDLPVESLSSAEISQGGQVYGDIGIHVRSLAFNMPVLAHSERETIEDMFAVVDIVKPVALFVWEENLDLLEPLYVTVTSSKLAFKKNPGGLTWSLPLEVREVF